jgi:RNA polymerase sigma factor for flagellar operon FliA
MKNKINSIKKAYLEVEKKLGRPPEAEEVAETLEITLDEYYGILQNARNGVTLRLDDFGERIHDEDGMDVTECIPDPDARTPLDIYEENDKRRMLAQLISELPEKEKLILSLYYWDEMTMKEIGRVLKLTEGRVCQLHAQALMRLKAKIER